MQRKFLEDMGLDKEVIDKIMAENGADIEKTKETLNTQIGDLTDQLNTATTTLKSFEDVDVKELQGKVIQLTTDLATKDTEYQSKLADMEFNSQLETVIASFKAKNSKAVRALIDVEALKASKNQAEDMKQSLESITKENPYLFGEVDKNPPPGNGGNPSPSGSDTLAGALAERYK